MSYKIQITVDEGLNKMIKAKAKRMGLSVSSYARLALMNLVQRENEGLLAQAIKDVSHNNTESLTLEEFIRQLDEL